MLKVLTIMLLTILISGCSMNSYQSTYRPIYKPQLTESGYATASASLVFFEHCFYDNYISAELVAFGKSYIRNELNKFNYSQTQIDKFILTAEEKLTDLKNDRKKKKEFEDICKKINLDLAEEKLNHAEKQKILSQKLEEERTQRIINSNQNQNTIDSLYPKTGGVTFCNNIGFQVVCNTY